MTYQELLKSTQHILINAKAECADASKHAEDIILEATGISREKLLIDQDKKIEGLDYSRVKEILERRLKGEPLQYILGFAWFWNSKFHVGPGALIPRRETEHLVEFLLQQNKTNCRIAELGAGTGNIGISVLQEKKNWEWLGFELNPDSLQYLEENKRNLLDSTAKYQTVKGDFFELAQTFGPYDIVVSNPPYVSIDERHTLSKEVLNEPDLALFSGASGLEHIEKLLSISKNLLKQGGLLVSEMACTQGTQVKSLALSHGYKDVTVLKDMASLDRVLIATWG